MNRCILYPLLCLAVIGNSPLCVADTWPKRILNFAASVISHGIARMQGATYYQQYRLSQDLATLEQIKKRVTELLARFAHEADTKFSEDTLKKRFTTKNHSEHTIPPIDHFLQQITDACRELETLQQQLLETKNNWENTPEAKNLIQQAQQITTQIDTLLRKLQPLELQLAYAVPFIAVLIVYTRTSNALKELLQSTNIHKTVLCRYGDPSFPYPYIKCATELVAYRKQLADAEQTLIPQSSASQSLAKDTANLQSALTKLLEIISPRSLKQQHEKESADQKQRQLATQEALALAEQEHAQAEQISNQEKKRANDLKEKEIRQQLLHLTTRLSNNTTDPLAHKTCNDHIITQEKIIHAQEERILALQILIQKLQQELQIVVDKIKSLPLEHVHAQNNTVESQENKQPKTSPGETAPSSSKKA